MFDTPILDAMGQPIKQPEKKDDGKKPAQTREEMPFQAIAPCMGAE